MRLTDPSSGIPDSELAEVDLEVRQSGEASVGELYLDGAPWRERVR